MDAGRDYNNRPWLSIHCHFTAAKPSEIIDEVDFVPAFEHLYPDFEKGVEEILFKFIDQVRQLHLTEKLLKTANHYAAELAREVRKQAKDRTRFAERLAELEAEVVAAQGPIADGLRKDKVIEAELEDLPPAEAAAIAEAVYAHFDKYYPPVTPGFFHGTDRDVITLDMFKSILERSLSVHKS